MGSVDFAEDLLKKHPLFDPCQSICNESQLTGQAIESQDTFDLFQDYFSQRGTDAFAEPKFAYFVIMMASLGEIFPPNIRRLAMLVTDQNSSPSNIEAMYLSAGAAIEFPKWLTHLNEIKDQFRETGGAMDRLKAIHQDCVDGYVSPSEAQLQCRALGLARKH